MKIIKKCPSIIRIEDVESHFKYLASGKFEIPVKKEEYEDQIDVRGITKFAYRDDTDSLIVYIEEIKKSNFKKATLLVRTEIKEKDENRNSVVYSGYTIEVGSQTPSLSFATMDVNVNKKFRIDLRFLWLHNLRSKNSLSVESWNNMADEAERQLIDLGNKLALKKKVLDL